MSLVDLARLIRRTGRIAEPAPAAPSEQPSAQGADGSPTASADGLPARDLPRELRGSVQVRHVDAGSCNGCEIELAAAFGPVYDAERYGARLVASPRHADAVLVTGVVTRNMAEPLRLTVEATPQPRVVLAVGDCARDCGMFRGAYGVVGAASDVVPVDLSVPGCPPAPADIVAALRQVTGR
ncbi:oxidoreductase [Cellulomonas sp. 73-145]|uniref:NADH-quinone oxidoreductase subunit B family protein n=1 Tax=Cellulomonas sp. 73-145 TaxID=1895739 RepID=UPI000A5CAF5D|nr:oxidoreductase [Cellulomonas sp. 73-145]